MEICPEMHVDKFWLATVDHSLNWIIWLRLLVLAFYCVLNLKFAMELHHNNEMFTLLGIAIVVIFALMFLVKRCIIQKCRTSDTSWQTRIQPYNGAPVTRNQNEEGGREEFRRNSINNNSCIHDRRKPEENDERLCVTVWRFSTKLCSFIQFHNYHFKCCF